jgi:hypothetical protein
VATEAKNTKSYLAKTPILFDNEYYAEGDQIELTDKQAKALGKDKAELAPAPAAAKGK